ncbi:MAG: hypothetical protein HY748_01980 [Elusimicrobia bacterium]|nr:hypothetical protein [Elusimicrobiota bacterium]
MSMRPAWVVAGVLAAAGGVGPCFAQAPAPDIKASTRPLTVAELYPVEKMRDPFVKGAAGATAAGADACKPEDFSIHQLTLRAMMKDAKSDFALLADQCGNSFIYSEGRLFRGSLAKKNIVAGVTGRMVIAQKTLTLQTSEKDVQVLRLGEEEEKD